MADGTSPRAELACPAVALFVLSDLHLDEEGEARLFRDDRQGAKLASLCERVARGDAEVVLLGDVFDLTAMNPPARGLDRFFAELGVAAEPKPARGVRRLLEARRPRRGAHRLAAPGRDPVPPAARGAQARAHRSRSAGGAASRGVRRTCAGTLARAGHLPRLLPGLPPSPLRERWPAPPGGVVRALPLVRAH